MKSLLSSKETTAAGIAAFIYAIAQAFHYQFDGVDTTNPDWNAVVIAGITMIGLLRARDNNKTSEDVGAK